MAIYYLKFIKGEGINYIEVGGTRLADTDNDWMFSTPILSGTTLKCVMNSNTKYTFDGWYIDGILLSKKTSTDISLDEHNGATVEVRTVPRSYSVTLNTNDGTILNGNITSYYYGQGATLPTAEQMYKKGHTFSGWYSNSSFSGSNVTSISTTTSGNKTYYAKWTINTYTVSYDANRGTDAPNSQSGIYGSIITLSSIEPTRSGYTFLGWSSDKDAKESEYNKGSNFTIDDKNIILYAVWKKNGATIYYGINGSWKETKVYYGTTSWNEAVISYGKDSSWKQ